MTPLERSMRRSQGFGDVKRDPKPKKRQSSFKAAVKNADKWFAKYIVQRDGACVTCGSTVSLQCSHIFRRHAYTTRWDTSNAAAQCKPCHFSHHTHSEYPLHNWALRAMGQLALDELWLRSKQVSKFGASYIRELGESFRARVEEE